MVNNLYDDNERFNSDGFRLADEVNDVILPIIDRYVEWGFKKRDIESIIHGVVNDLMLNKLLGI